VERVKPWLLSFKPFCNTQHAGKKNKLYMALLGRKGLNKVTKGRERTPGIFHSKGVSPSEFR
jgi:hypothetical protein